MDIRTTCNAGESVSESFKAEGVIGAKGSVPGRSNGEFFSKEKETDFGSSSGEQNPRNLTAHAEKTARMRGDIQMTLSSTLNTFSNPKPKDNGLTPEPGIYHLGADEYEIRISQRHHWYAMKHEPDGSKTYIAQNLNLADCERQRACWGCQTLGLMGCAAHSPHMDNLRTRTLTDLLSS
ncbi:hypothetical protein [Mycobacterium sp. 236(2023)]|uniref:hypothetical protein n=1 Tax=Mycobacterium sp. 236(2023) TaxID=3038163 RepID=UPI0024157638|nr:hypothetical protein [Mycobacterium sp. 236(2023)]MDG4665140.1 hypothetical protein [Mycobacterium sp. 236(2023)]